jgi:hypothetical protein
MSFLINRVVQNFISNEHWAYIHKEPARYIFCWRRWRRRLAYSMYVGPRDGCSYFGVRRN